MIHRDLDESIYNLSPSLLIFDIEERCTLSYLLAIIYTTLVSCSSHLRSCTSAGALYILTSALKANVRRSENVPSEKQKCRFNSVFAQCAYFWGSCLKSRLFIISEFAL
jgi:hypothetical protein